MRTALIVTACTPEPCYFAQYDRLGFKPCGSAKPTIRNAPESKALTMQDVREIKVGGLMSKGVSGFIGTSVILAFNVVYFL